MTISFNRLGNHGHLGNQMFQYAALVGLAKKYDRKFCIPHKDVFGKAYYTELRSNIYDAFNIKPYQGISSFPTVNEGEFHFNEALFNNFPKQDVNLLGYFQSEKWFAHAREEVKAEFSFKEEFGGLAKTMREQLSGEVIALHVRRTDYVNNPNHDSIGMDYYEAALKEVPQDATVIVFTDDPEWAKVQPQFPDERFFVSETGCAYTDMALISMCDYHIIANSTFSWWGAWLSESKKVVAPKNWFGPALNHKTDDIYCEGWVVL